jgi:RES domain
LSEGTIHAALKRLLFRTPRTSPQWGNTDIGQRGSSGHLAAVLTGKWREDFVLTRNIGNEWLAAGASALLEVPSAILPETANFLLNPLHPDSQHVRVLWHEVSPYDRRLFKGR